MSLDLKLYLVADELHFRKGAIEDEVLQAVRGGVRLVQLREKTCSDEDFVQLARRVMRALKDYSVPLLINDRIEVAKKVGASGVHLGQSDACPKLARALLGKEAIVGWSVESLGQVARAKGLGVDYLGVSAIYPTSSKNNVQKIWGLEGLRDIRSKTDLPLVGIGGIGVEQVKEVIHAGANGVAVISVFQAEEDWEAKALQLLAQVPE